MYQVKFVFHEVGVEGKLLAMTTTRQKLPREPTSQAAEVGEAYSGVLTHMTAIY